jgi:hypothetical protein
MSYTEDYKLLKKIFNQNESFISIPNCDTCIENYNFTSPDNSLNSYVTEESIEDEFTFSRDSYSEQIAKVDDKKLAENVSFSYSIFKKKISPSKDVIILLHGLNEKSWDKYLPWAKKLVDMTGKSIILFPISFHMNRAPELWSNPRIMSRISRERNALCPNGNCSSFVNAAISTRLEFCPQRFFRSGLKTIYDILHLIGNIRTGSQKGIDKNAKIDFFSYSIGAFLSEIMFISNPSNLFDDSRLFMFCGGPVFEKMNPVSRYILDKKAYESLKKYYVKGFDSNVKNDSRLNWFFRETNVIGKTFMSMLELKRFKSFRETRLKELSGKIVSLSLVKDLVMPFKAAKETLGGSHGDTGIYTSVEDFPYEYDHVNPFPVIDKIAEPVNQSFESVFCFASECLS